MDTFDTLVQVFFDGHPHTGFHDGFIDRGSFFQEEPAVEDVPACDLGPVQKGAKLVGEHVFLHHDAHLETEIVPDFIVIVIKSVGDFDLKFALADTIIEHDDDAVMFDGLVVNLAVFQDKLTDSIINLGFLLRIQQIEV